MSGSGLPVGVIGVGRMGGRHARNIHRSVPDAHVRAVVDRDADRAAAVAEQCGGSAVHESGETLIADPAVAAIVIASPESSHAELTQACVAAGKPVLCEKPLATTVHGARSVVDAEVAVGRRLVSVGFMREFDPAHRSVAAVTESGKIGRPVFLRSRHDNLGEATPRTVRDVVVNSAIHDLHSVRWLLPGEIVEIHEQHGPDPSNPDVCGFLQVTVTMSEGGLASLEVNADSGYGYEVLVEMVAQRGSVSSPSPSEPIVRLDGVAARHIGRDWLGRFAEAYEREVGAWVEGVLGRPGPRLPTSWDGYMALVAAEAVLESCRIGSPVRPAAERMPPLFAR